MRRKLTVPFAIAILLTLVMAGCFGPATLIPELIVTSITPSNGSSSGGDRITLTGEALFEVVGGTGLTGQLSISVCGSPLQDIAIEGEVKTITLPPGVTTTIRIGATLTGTTSPATSDTSDVVVTLPDGQEAVLEEAYSCNDGPIALGRELAVSEDQPLLVTLSGSDPDDDPLTFTITSQPSNGSLGELTTLTTESTSNAQVTYTPNPNFNGADSFSFTVSDGTVTSEPATVSITVTPQGDGPVANEQTLNTHEDIPLAITLTGSDVDGDNLSFSVATNPTNGSLSGTAPNLTYTPNADFNGSDGFTFTASDGSTSSTPAIVDITVISVNDAPSFTATNPPAVPEDAGTQTVNAWAVFNPGPTDEAGQGVVGYTVTDLSNPTLFSVAPAVDTNGTLSFTPAANINGSSSFDVTVQDDGGTADGGSDTSSSQSFTITVDPGPDSPAAGDDAGTGFTTDEDTPFTTSNVLANDTDPDGDILSVGAVDTTTTKGLVSDNGDGTFDYDPNGQF
ncbi:MAG: tandem-95 repeat protein, partial [Trueperaceae bacterium]